MTKIRALIGICFVFLTLTLYSCQLFNSETEDPLEPASENNITAEEANENAEAFFNTMQDVQTEGAQEQGTSQEQEQSPEEETSVEQPGIVALDSANNSKAVGDDLPVSRALAAKMLSLCVADKSVIGLMDREITFSDTDSSMWYDKYINAAYVFKLVGGDGDKYHPTDSLTVGQAQLLLDRLYEDNKIKIKLTDENRNMPISYSLWVKLLNEILVNKAGENTVASEYGITEKVIIPLATPSNNSDLKEWAMVSDVGAYAFSGLNMDAYIDKQIKVQIKDGEIFAILSMESENPVLTNAYVTAATSDSITVYSGGAARTYSYNNDFGEIVGAIADITLNGSTAENVVLMDNKFISGVIKRVDKEALELDSGMFPLHEDVKIYSTTASSVRWKSLRDLVVGSSIAEFTLKDGKVCAAVINKKAALSKLRVAITQTGSFSLQHDYVELTCSSNFVVTIKGNDQTFNAGDVIKITEESKGEFFTDEQPRIYVKPLESGGRIQLLSITRQNINPQYRGEFEVASHGGKFSIVNEVSLEEYLYSVVPSEMPTSHGVEAAKVQAVTARSYAYNQFFENRYYNYGGNVDDTTLSQVYNNVPETQTAIEAVDNTKGLMLAYDGAVVSANFYSTGSGVSTNSGDVWAGGEMRVLPTATPEYLSSTKQYWGDDFGDLSNEENATVFFKKTDIKAYDASFAWFRWNVTMTAEELSRSINDLLITRYKASPHFVRTLVNGMYLMRPISDDGIGDLLDLEVTKRGEGGNIMEMIITGTKSTVKITTEYNARVLMSPKQRIEGREPIKITRSDGSQVTDFSLMPSAMFVIEKNIQESKLSSITFYGGGYGHGVGMSQNGVKGMLDEGLTYTQILEKYYPGTTIIEKKLQ